MADTRHATFAGVPRLLLRGLDPGQASHRPPLFILAVAAALLSVLAVRDLILGGPAVLEALVAAGLWGTLLTVACGLTVREAQAGARPEDTPGDPELHG